MTEPTPIFGARRFAAETARIQREHAEAERMRAEQWDADQNAKHRAEDEAEAAKADPMTPAEQRGLAACLIDVCMATAIIPCPMDDCIACRERNAAWEALYRLLEPKYQAMVQRFLVFAEMAPPGVPERDR